MILTATEIAVKFNIPDIPTRMSKVEVPSGVDIRASFVGPNKYGTSEGAVQFEIMMPDGKDLDGAWFELLKDL